MKTVLLLSLAMTFTTVESMGQPPGVTQAPEKVPVAAREDCSLAVSPDGQTLAVGGGTFSDTVLLYNRRTHRTQVLRLRGSMFSPPRLDREIDPSLYYMSACSVQVSGDGRTLVNGGTAINGAVGENISLNAWDVRTGKHLRLFGMGLVKGPGVAISPNGKLVACSGQEVKTPRALYGREIRFWNAETGKSAGTIQTQTPISALDFSPDGRLIATGGIIPSPFVQV